MSKVGPTWIARLRRFLAVVHSIAHHPIHRRDPVRAACAWIRLALSNLLTPTRQIAVPYVDGSILNWPEASTSVLNCARYGLGEYADMAFCLHLLRPDDLFCDVGANAGVYTILGSRAVGCKVVAVEPVPKTFDLLMQNVYANGVSESVDALRKGVGREAGRLHFTASLWSYNHVVKEPTANTVEVEVLPLDTILAGRAPLAIKIDVEGFEAEVLAGASTALLHPGLQAVLIEMGAAVEKYGSSLEGIRKTLASAGFSGPYWYEPVGRELVSVGTPGQLKYNELFVRDPEFVAGRVKSARRYEIHGAHV